MELFEKIRLILDFPLFSLGKSPVTLMSAIILILSTFLLIMVTRIVQRWVVHKLMSKSTIELGVRDAVASLARYVILVLGFIVIFQSAGLDLSAFSILFGALGVGIGFGLQSLTNNLVSGLVILVERPIKLGDRVEVGTVKGDVTKISMRATTIRTNSNISVIVPNTEFVTSTVINWSHDDRNVRVLIPVGVSYKEDPARIREILLDVVKQEPGVLAHPEPAVLFDTYGDSALNFNLSVWTQQFKSTPALLKSRLYFAIFDRFRTEGVEIPFPQQDVHIIDTPESRQGEHS